MQIVYTRTSPRNGIKSAVIMDGEHRKYIVESITSATGEHASALATAFQLTAQGWRRFNATREQLAEAIKFSGLRSK